MSCSTWVQQAVAGFSCFLCTLRGVGPSVGKALGPDLSVVGRYALWILLVPRVTYSHSIVVPVVFQVRWMSVRPEVEGAVSPCGGSGQSRGCATLWFCVPFTLRYTSVSGVGYGTVCLCLCPVVAVFKLLCQGDWRRVVTLCPVLKHGPRSARDAQVGRVVLGFSFGNPHPERPMCLERAK